MRVSGPRARDVARLVPRGAAPTPTLTHRRATPTTFACPRTGETLDRGILLWFDGPASFTGEDVAELHVHGSLAVTRALLDALSRLGARGGGGGGGGGDDGGGDATDERAEEERERERVVDRGAMRHAEPGEFTRRAFRNGKLDLTQAEGLADLLDAETTAQRRQALKLSGGEMRRAYDGWRARLIAAAAHVEAVLDFGEDAAIADDVFRAVAPDVRALAASLEEHLRAPRSAHELVRRGFRVALVGAPNVGKSSLLNALAGRDVAIVSGTPGTTRDAIEVPLDLGGYKVVVTDTAGVRDDVEDDVEREGIRRSERSARDADFVVGVVDASVGVGVGVGAAALPGWAAAPDLTVMNKIDLIGTSKSLKGGGDGAVVGVSCATNEGVDAFAAALRDAVESRVGAGNSRGAVDVDGVAITRLRHRARLEECVHHLRRFDSIATMEGKTNGRGGGHELAAEELRLAATALGHVTGHVDVEELLDVIFSDFCIGK